MTQDGPALSASIAGEVYDLNSAEIQLLDYDLGLAAVRRLSQRSPLQQGDTDLGWRLDPRFVDLFWQIVAPTHSLIDYRNTRARFLEVWVPRDDPVVLTFTFEDRVRALDVFLDGELSFADRVATTERASGVFKAPDPRLYDPTIHTALFNLSSSGAGGAGWAIPWAIPWAIGSDVLSLTLDLYYAAGSRLAAPEFPVIRIFGPITNPVIANITTNEDITLTANGGLSLATTANWVEIDLSGGARRDSKTLLNETGASVDQYLTATSDLASFHLAPAGEKLYDGSFSTGHNLIQVTGTGVTTASLVTVNYYDRYNGA